MNELEHQVDELVLEPRDEVWIARGLHGGWRVRSESRVFGEWVERDDAEAFAKLLIAGNPQLERIG